MATTELNATEAPISTTLLQVEPGDCFTADGIVFMRLGFHEHGSMAFAAAVREWWAQFPGNNDQDPWIPCACFHPNAHGGFTAMRGSVIVISVKKTEIDILALEPLKEIA